MSDSSVPPSPKIKIEPMERNIKTILIESSDDDYINLVEAQKPVKRKAKTSATPAKKSTPAKATSQTSTKSSAGKTAGGSGPPPTPQKGSSTASSANSSPSSAGSQRALAMIRSQGESFAIFFDGGLGVSWKSLTGVPGGSTDNHRLVREDQRQAVVVLTLVVDDVDMSLFGQEGAIGPDPNQTRIVKVSLVADNHKVADQYCASIFAFMDYLLEVWNVQHPSRPAKDVSLPFAGDCLILKQKPILKDGYNRVPANVKFHTVPLQEVSTKRSPGYSFVAFRGNIDGVNIPSTHWDTYSQILQPGNLVKVYLSPHLYIKGPGKPSTYQNSLRLDILKVDLLHQNYREILSSSEVEEDGGFAVDSDLD